MASNQGVIDPADFELTKAPILQASMPPPYFFTSEAVYQREVSEIFLKEWICVGRTEQVREAGDYFTQEIAGEPVIVSRDDAGELHALSAVCRHKSEIVATGAGNCRVFSCPYHGWTYGLNGQLLAARGMDSAERFDKARYGLPTLRLEVWESFIFINFDPHAQPLGRSLHDLSARLTNYSMAEMRITQREDYAIACNWKVWADNGTEAYHVDMVHQATALPDYPAAIWRAEEPHGPYEVLKVRPQSSGLETAMGASPVPLIQGLDEEQREQFLIVFIYPNLIVNLLSMAMIYGVIMPDGPDRCRLVGARCFPPPTLDSPEFDDGVQVLYATWEQLRREDIETVAPAQKGYRSRLAGRGRYSDQEQLPYRLHNYVIDRIL